MTSPNTAHKENFLLCLPLLTVPVVAELVCSADLPAWACMWILAMSVFLSCKWLTWFSACLHLKWQISWRRHLAYLLAWPGLDGRVFLDSSRHAPAVHNTEWVAGLTKTAVGIGCLLFVYPMTAVLSSELRGWCAGTFILLTLHFGLFDLLSCTWRSRGVTAPRLMNAPLLSNSLIEFWSERWNVAFRDITHQFLFRPLLRRLGTRGALFTGFLVSGLIHDLVISVPAHGGYGLPTLYFMIQATGIAVQKSTVASRLHISSGPGGRLFTVLFLVTPAFLLFHRPFMTEVLTPFADLIGG